MKIDINIGNHYKKTQMETLYDLRNRMNLMSDISSVVPVINHTLFLDSKRQTFDSVEFLQTRLGIHEVIDQ
jgi:hypothetical protein